MHKLNYVTGGGCRCAPAPLSSASMGFGAFLTALAIGLARRLPHAQRAFSPCEMSRHLARDIGLDCG